MLSDRCKCTLAAGSLITVTRSCGICTRFPFTLSRAPEGSAARQTMKGTCCSIFSFWFIIAHCIQKRKVLFVMFCRIFSAFLGVLTAAGAKSHTSVSYPAAWRHARSYRRFWPAAHPWGKGVGRHGNNGHLRGIGFGQRTDGRRARFCILSVYNFKSLAVGMAVW